MYFASKPTELLRILNLALKRGGVHIIGNKQVGKSNAKKVLASLAIQKLPNTKTIIIDTVGKWRFDFDKIGFYTIPKGSLTISEIPIGYRMNGLPFYRKGYRIEAQTEREVKTLLEGKQPIIFDLELEDTEEIGYFEGYIMQTLYEKQRIRNKYWKGKLKDSYLLFLEEAENVFDSSFDKKLFNRTRKIYNELANYKIGIVSSSQALTEVNAKFRRKMALFLIGKSSLTDYDLKLRRLLRHSKHRADILSLKIGSFLDTSTDKIIGFPEFKQEGKPYEIKRGFCIKPKILKPQPQQPKPKKEPLWKRFLKKLGLLKELPTPRSYRIEEDTNESEELNAIMAETDEEDEEFFWD